MQKIVILSLIILSTAFSQPINEALKQEALEHMKFERYGEAIELFNRYISANPQKSEGYNLRAICNERRGLYEQAVYDLRTSTKINSSDKGIFENLARVTNTWHVLINNNIAGYKREIAINPTLPVNYLKIGIAFKNLGDWSKAEEWYDKYLNLEEASADEIIRYTEILSSLNKISKGEPILKLYTEKYPDDHRLWSRYGYFTLWLGKNKIAIEAFENSLKLRPFFKEAVDGLARAQGNGYVFVVNDTSRKNYYGTQTKEYAIDRYFRKLRVNPNDNATRILLIKELISANRFDEAQKELERLSSHIDYIGVYLSLNENFNFQKQKYFKGKIAEIEKEYSLDQLNDKLLLKLTDYYINLGEYKTAKRIYGNFLWKNSTADNVRYKFALHSAWFKDFCTTKKELTVLLLNDPNNHEYLYLKIKYALWADVIEPELVEIIDKIEEKFNNDFGFYSTAASILIRLNKTEKAQVFIEKAEKLNASSPVIAEIITQLLITENSIENQRRFALLEEARVASFHNNCTKSIELYENYLLAVPKDIDVQRELSNAYQCDGNFKSAISVYNEILLADYNYADAVKRAKLFLWSGDSLNALREFKKLNAQQPNDKEVKLLLGDAYLAAGLQQNAKIVYTEMLSLHPESYIINKRLSWLTPVQYTSGFPTYLMFIPEANFFNDNIGLRYHTQGVSLQAGLNEFLSAGISFYRGDLRSDSGNIGFNILKGNIFLKLNKYISASAGFGRTLFNRSFNSNITEVSIKTEKESVYYVAAAISSSDAAHILYSPFLLDQRMNAKNYSLSGKYFAVSNTFLSGRFLYNNISDSNDGYHLDLRLGENFNKKISAGYEYSYISYSKQSFLYWSPEKFESHSLWAEWSILKDSRTGMMVGGKVGLIPENDFILREISGSVNHKFFDRLTFQGSITAGSTVKQETGYSSTSFRLAVFWTL